MHSHLTTHLVTAMQVEAAQARPRHQVARRQMRRAALRLPHRHTAARHAIRPA